MRQKVTINGRDSGNHCWNMINLTPRNKLQVNCSRNSYIFIENAFRNVVIKMATISSRPLCFKCMKCCRYSTDNAILSSAVLEGHGSFATVSYRLWYVCICQYFGIHRLWSQMWLTLPLTHLIFILDILLVWYFGHIPDYELVHIVNMRSLGYA